MAQLSNTTNHHDTALVVMMTLIIHILLLLLMTIMIMIIQLLVLLVLLVLLLLLLLIIITLIIQIIMIILLKGSLCLSRYTFSFGYTCDSTYCTCNNLTSWMISSYYASGAAKTRQDPQSLDVKIIDWGVGQIVEVQQGFGKRMRSSVGGVR